MLDRRPEILQAAFEIFAKRGFSKATMDEIALEAGVSKGTLYLYYTSKRALFMSLYMDIMTRFVSQAQKAADGEGTPPERLRATLLVVSDIMKQSPNWTKLLTELMVNAVQNEDLYEIARTTNYNNLKLVASLIQDGIEGGYFRAVDPMVAAMSVHSGLSGVTGRVILYSDWDLTENVEFFIDLILRGLAK